VWEEDYDLSESYLFLVIGEGTIRPTNGGPTPSYKLLDLETGNTDEVPQSTLENSSPRHWKRIA
jgi:hypothetical protein